MADSTSSFLTFVNELKRRRVFRVAAVYAAVGFVIAQAAALLQPALLLPEWTYRLVVFLLLLGFPVALVLAWSFDITPQGVQRTDRRKQNAGDPAPHPAAAPAQLPSRAAVYAGLGILVALVGFGGYAYLGAGAESADAHLQTATGADARHTIAVLPLRNLAGGEENEYFADGVTEDLLTNLGLVPDFTVISRTSVMRYKETDRSLPEIARELGAQYVVEGSIRRAGERVRVVVQLVEPGTDTQIWARTMDRRIEDIFALQSGIAHSVVEALRVELTGGVAERIRRAPTQNLAAYEIFLQGRELSHVRTEPAMQRAIELFERAVAKDPGFALAHAWLGIARATYAYQWSGDAALWESALVSARRAVALQPDLGDAHRALGLALIAAGRLDEAIPALERALALNPNDGAASGNLGLAFAFLGELDRNIEHTRAMIARDPARAYLAYGNLASAYRSLRLHERSMQAARRALELSPGHDNALNNLALTLSHQGRTEEALAVAERLIREEGTTPWILGNMAVLQLRGGDEARAARVLERAYSRAPERLETTADAATLGYLLARAGETERARELLDRSEGRIEAELESGSSNPWHYLYLARISVVRGEHAAALDRLDRAVEGGWNHPDWALHDPLLARFQDEPRFRTAIARMEARIEPMRERVLREGW